MRQYGSKVNSKLRPFDEILAAASDNEVRLWHSALCDGLWPESMPIPLEAAFGVWHRLLKRVVASQEASAEKRKTKSK